MSDYICITKNEAYRFAKESIVAAGGDEEAADELATVLVEADYRGHYSHGINRVHVYARDISTKICNPSALPTILKESPATAWVDGNNALGPRVGIFCMNLAMEKALSVGIGIVSCKGSNHFGIAGYYSMLALEKGLVGLSFTMGSPVLGLPRTNKCMLSSNPISMAAPGTHGDSFVLDMATAAVALGKVEIQKSKNQKLPKGWGMDKNGDETTDPNALLNGGSLYPLGGKEETCGYKGFGLNVMVEILTSIFGGSLSSHETRIWTTTSAEANLGHCFIAINPNCFAPDFSPRLQTYMNLLRQTAPLDEEKPVLIAGDPEREHMKKVDTDGGIQYHVNTVETFKTFAEKIGIEPMKTLDNP